MLATEPSAIWGAGPGAEPIGWWERLLDSIASDPRAVATIIAAFVGFLGGVLIKDWLDRRRETKRQGKETIQLAAAIHAEIYALRMLIEGSLVALQRLIEKAGNNEIHISTAAWLSHEPPEMEFFSSRIGQLDKLPRQIAGDLILLNMAITDLQRLIIRSVQHVEESNSQVGSGGLRVIHGRFINLVRKIEALNEPLAAAAGVNPHDWQELLEGLRFLDEPRAPTVEDSARR
jgi:hypothetical protein